MFYVVYRAHDMSSCPSKIIQGELLGVLARPPSETGKKGANTKQVPWRFIPDEDKLTQTKVDYSLKILERVAQLYQRQQGDYKLESQKEAEELQNEQKVVEQLRQLGAGTGDLYTSGAEVKSAGERNVKTPTLQQRSDLKRKEKLISKLLHDMKAKVQENNACLREYGGLRGVHFTREESYSRSDPNNLKVAEPNYTVSAEPGPHPEKSTARTSMSQADDGDSAAGSFRGFDEELDVIRNYIIKGNIQRALEELNTYPECREHLLTYEGFPRMTSLAYGFEYLVDGIVQAYDLGDFKNQNVIKHLQMFHQTLQQAASDGGVVDSATDSHRSVALKQASKRLQREVNEVVDTYARGELGRETTSANQRTSRTSVRGGSTKGGQAELDNTDGSVDSSDEGGTDTIADAIEASVGSDEQKKGDGDEAVSGVNIDTGEDELFDSSALRENANNRRADHLLEHFLQQQGRDPLVNRYANLQKEKKNEIKKKESVRRENFVVDTTPSEFLCKHLPPGNKKSQKDTPGIASRQNTAMTDSYQSLRLKLHSGSTNRSRSGRASRSHTRGSPQQLPRISSAPFFEVAGDEGYENERYGSPEQKTRYIPTSSLLRRSASGDVGMRSTQTRGSRTSLVNRAMKITDQLSNDYLDGRKSPLFRADESEGDDSGFSPDEGGRSTPATSEASGSRSRTTISGKRLKGLLSDVQDDPVMCRLVNHLFSERVLGAIQAISTAAEDKERQASDAIKFLEMSEKERQQQYRKQASQYVKHERQQYREQLAKSAVVKSLPEQEEEENRKRTEWKYHKALHMYGSRYHSSSDQYLFSEDQPQLATAESETPHGIAQKRVVFDMDGNLTEATKKRIPELLDLLKSWTPICHPVMRAKSGSAKSEKEERYGIDLGIPSVTTVTQPRQARRTRRRKADQETKRSERRRLSSQSSEHPDLTGDSSFNQLPDLHLYGSTSKSRFPKFGGSGSPSKPPAITRSTGNLHGSVNDLRTSIFENPVEQYSPRLQRAIKGRVPTYRFGAASAGDVLSVKALFDLHDGDGDGLIDVREFVQSKAWQKSDIGRLAATMFDSIDTNSDGFIGLGEFLSVIFPHARREDIHLMVDYCEGIYDTSAEGLPQPGNAPSKVADSRSPPSPSGTETQPGQRRKSVTFQE